MSAFFEEWLVPGAKAFVSRRWPTAPEAVEIIHEAGGAAVLAHPFWDMDEPERGRGARSTTSTSTGSSASTRPTTGRRPKFLLELCRDRGLAATGSSDFHGPSHKMFNSFCAYPTYDLGEPELPPATRLGGLGGRDQLALLEQRDDLRAPTPRPSRARCRG